jgi:hypothetical protein
LRAILTEWRAVMRGLRATLSRVERKRINLISREKYALVTPCWRLPESFSISCTPITSVTLIVLYTNTHNLDKLQTISLANKGKCTPIQPTVPQVKPGQAKGTEVHSGWPLGGGNTPLGCLWQHKVWTQTRVYYPCPEGPPPPLSGFEPKTVRPYGLFG